MAQHFLEGRLSAFVEHTEKAIADCQSDAQKLPLYINLAAAQYGKMMCVFTSSMLRLIAHVLKPL